MSYNDDESEWDDGPWADPQIQKDYEAALGEFLVGFNQIENIINDVIVLALAKAERKDILNLIEHDLFSRKVLILELLSLRFPEAASRPLIIELRELGSERNKLAHGHFDQNPFDGSYELITRKKRLDMPVDKIRSLTERADKAYDQLRSSEVRFSFFDKIEATILAQDD